MNSTILTYSNRTDGDAAHRPRPEQTRYISNDHVWMRWIASYLAMQRDLRPLLHGYQVTRLPGGYSGYSVQRINSNTLDHYLFGHPSHRTYDSWATFRPHFDWLQREPRDDDLCDCRLCEAQRKNEHPKKRAREDLTAPSARKRQRRSEGPSDPAPSQQESITIGAALRDPTVQFLSTVQNAIDWLSTLDGDVPAVDLEGLGIAIFQQFRPAQGQEMQPLAAIGLELLTIHDGNQTRPFQDYTQALQDELSVFLTQPRRRGPEYALDLIRLHGAVDEWRIHYVDVINRLKGQESRLRQISQPEDPYLDSLNEEINRWSLRWRHLVFVASLFEETAAQSLFRERPTEQQSLQANVQGGTPGQQTYHQPFHPGPTPQGYAQVGPSTRPTYGQSQVGYPPQGYVQAGPSIQPQYIPVQAVPPAPVAFTQPTVQYQAAPNAQYYVPVTHPAVAQPGMQAQGAGYVQQGGTVIQPTQPQGAVYAAAPNQVKYTAPNYIFQQGQIHVVLPNQLGAQPAPAQQQQLPPNIDPRLLQNGNGDNNDERPR
ncbi:hypothetical protein K470DRAFT_261392 [Piedraia hortae CBS 480.64]|uniref:Cryptic loci regulator 2 N-terminal domain-containing protein n=1 Tax=Piedraia hortae CBS 480.64 TaxID=1314780 RepID=A0A6A7CBH5_9PEZI|nr:hypothetical protein K470DRAFT_261392 [Piedraia hortae CBS 480.64]